MTYYRLRTSLDEKIMGEIPQVKEVIYNGSVEAPEFVGKIYFTKVDFTPVVANPVLHPKANKTDIIESFGMGSDFKIMVSEKLKNFRKI